MNVLGVTDAHRGVLSGQSACYRCLQRDHRAVDAWTTGHLPTFQFLINLDLGPTTCSAGGDSKWMGSW